MTTNYIVISGAPGVSEDTNNGVMFVDGAGGDLPSTSAVGGANLYQQPPQPQQHAVNGGESNGVAIGGDASGYGVPPTSASTSSAHLSLTTAAVVTVPGASASTSTESAIRNLNNGNSSFGNHSNDDKGLMLSSGFVTLVGEMNGIADLSADIGADIARFVSRLMRSIIGMAKKYKDRARRRMLTVDDLNAAAAFFGISAQHGYQLAASTQFRQIAGAGEDLFVIDEHDVELNGYVGVGMPKLPLKPTIKTHWLVIEGVQPAIPENPVPPAAAIVANGTAVDDGTTSDGALSAGDRPPPVLLNAMARGVRKTEQVQIKTTTTHALSLEQQIFFKEITEAIMGNDENRRLEALNCLAVDCGLQALLPRFSITIAEGVRCNIAQHNLAILIYLMRMAQSLVQNESLSLERCLHELLPAIMSCILSRQLCSTQSDSHWTLREYSAKLLVGVVKKYEHAMLQSRITRALARAFTDPNSALTTLYGAVFALNQLGADTTRAVVAAKADIIYAAIRRVVSDPNATPSEKSAANRLRGELTSCMSAMEGNAVSA